MDLIQVCNGMDAGTCAISLYPNLNTLHNTIKIFGYSGLYFNFSNKKF